MAKLIYKLITFVLVFNSSSCSLAGIQAKTIKTIKLDNSLKECVQLTQAESTQTYNNTTLLTIKHTTTQSIAHCGCKSALAQYRVQTTHQEIASGLLDFRENNSLNLTLSNTSSLPTKDDVTISVSCSQPL